MPLRQALLGFARWKKVMGFWLRMYVGHFSHPSVGNATANWFLAWAGLGRGVVLLSAKQKKPTHLYANISSSQSSPLPFQCTAVSILEN